MKKRWAIIPALLTAVILIVILVITGCDNGTGAEGDYLEAGHNYEAGVVGITATGTVTVTHGLGTTPSSVVVTNALVQSGSGVIYSVPTSGITSTKFTIYGYKVKATGGVTAAASGSVSYMATTE